LQCENFVSVGQRQELDVPASFDPGCRDSSVCWVAEVNGCFLKLTPSRYRGIEVAGAVLRSISLNIRYQKTCVEPVCILYSLGVVNLKWSLFSRPSFAPPTLPLIFSPLGERWDTKIFEAKILGVICFSLFSPHFSPLPILMWPGDFGYPVWEFGNGNLPYAVNLYRILVSGFPVVRVGGFPYAAFLEAPWPWGSTYVYLPR